MGVDFLILQEDENYWEHTLEQTSVDWVDDEINLKIVNYLETHVDYLETILVDQFFEVTLLVKAYHNTLNKLYSCVGFISSL